MGSFDASMQPVATFPSRKKDKGGAGREEEAGAILHGPLKSSIFVLFDNVSSATPPPRFLSWRPKLFLVRGA